MPEFRTRAPGDYGQEGSGGGGLEKHIERVIDNIKNDPKLKAEIYQELKDNGVNPAVIRAIVPEMQEAGDIQVPQNQVANDMVATQEESHEGQTEVRTEVKKVTEKPSPEQLLELIDEIAEVVPNGKETTLEELKEMAEDNPGIVETAIEMKL